MSNARPEAGLAALLSPLVTRALQQLLVLLLPHLLAALLDQRRHEFDLLLAFVVRMVRRAEGV
jgi:hypothetical protein